MNKLNALFSAALTMGAITVLVPKEAKANNWGTIAENVTTSIEEVPGLLTGLAYLMGILLGVLGVVKIKDHVENPTQTPMREGAIRLAAGGTLFSLPIIFEAMLNTIGETSASVEAPSINKVDFNVN